MGNTIANAVSPEEKPIIENIISLFQQLLSLQGNDTIDPASIEMTDDNMDDQNDDDVNKTDEGETGDSPAEERLDETTSTTDESLQDIVKNLAALVQKKKTNVQKSVVNPDNSLVAEIKKIGQAITAVSKNQTNQGQLIGHLFDALGFSDKVIEKALPKPEPRTNTPVQNIDTAKVVKEVVAEVFKSVPAVNQNQEYRHPFNQKKNVRKDLDSVLQFIANKK